MFQTEEMGNQPSAWSQTFNEIKSQHNAAYYVIQEAVTCEEQGKPLEALEKYKQGIEFIDKALSIQVTCPQNPEPTWEKAVEMIQKMKKTRGEVLSRITSIQLENNELLQQRERPPTYDEAVASTPTEITYHDLGNALQEMSVNSVDTDKEIDAEVVFICENVKLYFISASGEVSSTLTPQTLKIILVENDEGQNVPRAIMQVGDWVYPLVPGVSPCFRTDYGAFILPNIYAEASGSSIGLILPPDADEEVYDILESVLYGIVGEVGKPQPKEISDKISEGIVSGAGYVAKGLQIGADKIGTLLYQTTPKLLQKIDSADRPTEIPPKVAKGMQIAETATNKAAKVTGYVAEQVGVATMKLGHFLAPHIQKQGTRLLTSGFKMSEAEASRKVKGVMTVAAGAVEGFATIYSGLESSANILGTSLKDNTVKVIQHKYGNPAGEFSEDTLKTMGNIYHISKNAKIIQPKNLAKRTAKEAGKAVVSEYRYRDEGASTSMQVAPFPKDENISKK